MSKKVFKGGKGLSSSRRHQVKGHDKFPEDDMDAFQMQREKILLDEDSDVPSGEDFDEAVMNLPSEDESSLEESADNSWGRSKKAFYSADASIGDLQDEAREAKKLQKRLFSSLAEEDFGISHSSNSKSKSKSKLLTLEVSEDEADYQHKDEQEFEDRFATAEEITGLDSEALVKLVPQEEMINIRAKYSPELKSFFDEFSTKLHEVRNTIEPTLKRLRGDSSKGLSFLETKYQLLLGYCANLSLYLLLKVEGKNVERHPVVERLIKYRLLIEKIKPMEAKLQYQIDKLLHAATSAKDNVSRKPDDEDRELAFRPNLDMLAGPSGDELDMEESDKDIGHADKPYRAPKVAPVHYNGDNKDGKLNGVDKLEERERILASRSRLLADLQADMDEKPEEEMVDPVYGRSATKMTSSKQREQYEEENFVRFTMSKKEQRRLEKLQGKPIDELEDLNDFFKESSKIGENGTRRSKGAVDRLLGLKVSPGSRRQQASGDDDVPAKRRYNPSKGESKAKVSTSGGAESDDMSEIEDDMDLDGEDDFYKSVKKMNMSKKNQPRQHGLAPNYRPIKDLSPGGQRPASYEMMKNKGLTPARPKDVRNPRVRQRNKWEKAQKRIRSFKAVPTDKKTPYSGETSGIRTNLSRSVRF